MPSFLIVFFVFWILLNLEVSYEELLSGQQQAFQSAALRNEIGEEEWVLVMMMMMMNRVEGWKMHSKEKNMIPTAG
ncbi:hypothetical protein EYF80_048414 [Liparis tanakae]|uniref:Uncharacterized protein n=1 Tax=Liparis tanakae TaxID=230148 RepID=A0A4Z2FM96_9TELE|nr:hypothetical protein EYF80_048414 [Liparis tanakae]